MKTDAQYIKEIKFYLHQKYQDIILQIDTALIDSAIDELLKDNDILRNENIPNEEQVINENDYIADHENDDDLYAPEEDVDENVQIDETDLQEEDEDWERNDHL